MSLLAFFVVGTLTGYKVLPETRTSAPFEWVGELLGMAVIVIFALTVAMALTLVGIGAWTVPDFAPSLAEIRGDVPRYYHWRF